MRHAYLVAIYVTLAAVVLSGRQRAVGSGFRWSALLHAAFGLAATAIFAFGMPMPPDIGEVMRMPYVGDVLRLRALTFSPSMLGALLTATAPFVFAAALADDAGAGRRWALAGVAVVATMLLTFSHTVAGFLVAALFVAWPLLSVRRPLRLAAACAVVAVADLLQSHAHRVGALAGVWRRLAQRHDAVSVCRRRWAGDDWSRPC